MKEPGELHRWLRRARPALFVLPTLLPFAALGQTPAPKQKAQLMFVQVAEDMRVDAAAQTLRLVKVGQQTLYFSDRPVRIAGHLPDQVRQKDESPFENGHQMESVGEVAA